MKYPQTATYWAPATVNEFNELSYEASIITAVRWEDKISKVNTPEMEEITSKAIVYSPIDFEIGGYLYLGESTELTPDTEPDSNPILFFDRQTNLTGTRTIRKAIL